MDDLTVPFPLTDLQAAYLVGTSELVELGGFLPGYHLELDVVGLDVVRARDVLRALIRRHEHLRTVVTGDATQRVLDVSVADAFEIEIVDVTGLGRDEQEKSIAATRQRMREQGVDPTTWPLFDLVVHRIRTGRVRLQIAMTLLLLDGRSIHQVVGEFLALVRDPMAELAPVTTTFREALARIRDRDDSTDWAYWEQRLETLPDAPQLPLARPLSAVSPVRFQRRMFTMTPPQWKALCGNARRRKLMPMGLLLHVYSEVLGAWAAAPRFSVTVMHHNWAGIESPADHPVGQLGATLPVEVDLTCAEDFWTRGQQLQKQLWRDMRHASVTGVRITRELAAQRGWGSRPAFPYVFNNMLGNDTATLAAGRPVCRTVTHALSTPQVLIDNQTQDAEDGGVEFIWDMVDAAFPAGLPDALFDTYRRLLETITSDQETTLVVTPAGHLDLIATINSDQTRPPAGRLEDSFLRSAAEHPEAPAVFGSGRTLTYGELESLSRAVALRLRARGVGDGVVVPVVMSKGWEQVVAVLGVLRAGGAYCPVEASLPAERIRTLVNACASGVVLTESSVRVRDVDSLDVDLVAPADDPLPPPSGDGSSLAYVIYTSGSTGTPKGVMIEHGAALNTVVDINRRIRLEPDDRVFAISSLSFDLSVWDVFGTLAAGAALVLPAASARPDPEAWLLAARRHGATVWNSVPALAELLVEVAAGRDVPPLRAILLSGDWIPLPLPDRLRALWPAARVIAMGGATEASIWSNIFEVGAVDPEWRSIPYGRPLRNQTMTVRDHRLNVRAPWATGAIYIGGVGVARGYAGDAERTAEKFVHDPATGDRLYATGDLGRYWPDGTIEFLGRADRQVKIQGFRVEPGEIEAVVRELAGVRECVVAAEGTPGGRMRLVAVVVPEDGASLDVAAHIRARLPHYMVPARIAVVPELPLTANGKVDISAARTTAPADEVVPAADTARLAAIWSSLLDLPTVGPDADFFACGGNSLLALRLVHRVRDELGVDLRFGEIFEVPTLGALAARIAEGGPGHGVVRLSDRPGRPLYLFHPVGGAVTAYRPVAAAWPGPVMAFQSPALVGRESAGDLVGMAAAARRELPDSGPYLLAGWSMGGFLAYEVSRQLADEGHRSAVVMIDSRLGEFRVPTTEAERQREFLTDLAGGTWFEPVTDAAQGHRAAVAAGLLPEGTDLATYTRLADTHAHNLAALADYTPAEPGGPVLLFAAGPGPDPRSWLDVCPQIDIRQTAGDHYTVMRADSLREITATARDWFEEALDYRRTTS
ncbi:amino acid adenylation domain-containing protein [Micromonospora sp. NIE79]|uniref:Amino acid adenylation domain-containing protein n=1 Tax=Micromonospora trifolii TaxID=2911208 RepID=A0ABS9N652_9ACTN|nr:amino acid adenylation domain-containing protein [Micromonospora trifolii]MCG5445421.1 amino acid adenylation domain-containing protein [Micromonospora trifolii]